jgi:exopolysaccharide biosynthesis predicted pyruvyltransferase EpsI
MSDVAGMVITVDDGEAISLEEFISINEFSPEEKDEIISSLLEKGSYIGGGGAFGEFTVKVVSR